jgi:hypothetical protein
MTKDQVRSTEEALKLALEALIYGHSYCDTYDAIAAIKQALAAPVQEPVEFFDWYDNAHWGNEDFKEGCHRSWNAAIKYTTPPAQPAPVQEPIGYLFQHDETGLTTVVDVQQVEWGFEKNNPRHQKIGPVYTTPPAAQRTWVGLTDGEISQLWLGTSPYFNEDDFARAIEAKLKERNT